MGRLVAIALTCACACGRIAFDPIGEDDPALGSCLVADFNDGQLTDWTVVEPDWSVVPGFGPDGSSALRSTSPGNTYRTIAPPALRGVRAVSIDLAFRVEDSFQGDFIVMWIPTGWATPSDPRYEIGIYPQGSDTAPDHIGLWPQDIDLATTTSTIAAATWYRASISIDTRNAMTVKLDGIDHMSSAADASLAGPFDVLLRFWLAGALDNVTTLCAY